MVPNDVINRLIRIDRQLQAEAPTDELKLARARLEDAMFWIGKEKERRVIEKKRDLEERLAAQQEETT